MKKLVVIVAIICVTGALYFYLAPVYMHGAHVLLPRRFASIQEARSYYGVASSFFAALSASLGIALGYFYYSDRKANDARDAERGRVRASVRMLLDLLSEYDHAVIDILCIYVKDQPELDRTRMRVRAYFDEVVAVLSASEKILALTESEIRTVLRVHSLVDRNDTLTVLAHQELTREKLDVARGDYMNRIQAARAVCYSKIV